MTKKVLVISPHTDDAEVGAGGALLRFVEECKIYHVALSDCMDIERNLGFNLKEEFEESLKFIGVQGTCRTFKNRRFSEQALEIRDYLENLKLTIDPDVVFCPSSCDIHQDHREVYYETFRVFRNTTILGYESPRSSMGFRPTLYVGLDEDIVEKKCRLVSIYKSQSNEYYMQKDGLIALLRHRGVECGRKFAEGFEVIRMVV